MVERRPGDEGVLGGDPELGAQHQVARHLGAVADDRALGQPGGAAGVEDEQRVFGVDLLEHGVERGAPQQRLVTLAEDDRLDPRTTQRRQRVPVPGRDQNAARLDQLEAMGELGRGEPPVLAGGDGAEPGGGDEELEVFEAVLGNYGDAGAALDPALGEHGGEPPRALVELAVAEASRAILDGGAPAVDPRLRGEQARHRAHRALAREGPAVVAGHRTRHPNPASAPSCRWAGEADGSDQMASKDCSFTDSAKP